MEGLKGKLVSVETELADKTAQLSTVTERLDAIERKLALTNKQLLGPKAERMPTPEAEAKKREGKGGDEVRPIGEGARSVEFEWVPGHVERRVHLVEVGRCPCKMHYARGPAPRRVQEGCLYGPAFLAKLAVDKCADGFPLYCVEKQLRRKSIPISRSTLNDNALLAGELLFPLWQCAHDLVRHDSYVQADKTSIRMQARSDQIFVWTFLSKLCTVYVFSPSRSGDTAHQVLGGTTGKLTIDGYTGYNVVTDVKGRERRGCWSHARCCLFDALPYAPEAREGLDLIMEIFMVEREAAERGIVGTAAYLTLRRTKSALAVERLRVWRERLEPLFEPRSAMGEALRYIKNQWSRLTAFLTGPRVPIHNNASEAALRIIALARKVSLFFGSEEAARKLMVLYSLIATCERHGVNPETYLADVLLRIQDYPKERLVGLLPHRWKQTFGAASVNAGAATPADAT